MGLMTSILGAGSTVAQVGDAVGGVAEVFVGNRADRDAADAKQALAALEQFGVEFQQASTGPFDRFMDGLNRLPRPLLVVGTLGMFTHAMIAPASFAVRMQGLALVPDPLWWLLGAIVSFYFGARELHYQRVKGGPAPRISFTPPPETADPAPEPTAVLQPLASPLRAAGTQPRVAAKATPPAKNRAADPRFNAAIEEWRSLRG